MSLPVHLVPGLAEVVAGQPVEVTGDEAHHAVAVRRLRAGERVVLTDGAGTRVVGTVESTGRRSFLVHADAVDRLPRPEPELVVVQAIPKGDRGELAVEVLTEVGVGRIVPWAAARCVAVWKGERVEKSLARWRATAREAGKQARRAWGAEVDDLARTPEVVDLLATADAAYVLHEQAELSLAGSPVPASGRIVLVVGPEGGLTPEELGLFEDAGARPLRLGPEVLRTSTAGVVAAAALLSRTGRWA
jgi:16S rRNA (uracil1498-N3)-methyltransferase